MTDQEQAPSEQIVICDGMEEGYSTGGREEGCPCRAKYQITHFDRHLKNTCGRHALRFRTLSKKGFKYKIEKLNT